MSNDTFQDFCQAWTSRFPNSELPEAWEEDVRQNLAKHRGRVLQLREELEKEEMYVLYLDKLLTDIEVHRAKGANKEVKEIETKTNGTVDPEPELDVEPAKKVEDYDNDSMDCDEKEGDKQKFLDDQCLRHSLANLRSSLHLDLESVEEDLKKSGKNPFVTVINVKSPDGQAKKSSQELHSEPTKFKFDGGNSKKMGPKTSTKPEYRRESQESLNSISSPLSPTSPIDSIILENLLSPREAPASPREHALFDGSDSSLDPSPTNTRTKPDPPERTVSVQNENVESKSNSSCEDLHSFQSRGRPDGGEMDEVSPSPPTSVPVLSSFTSSKVKDLKSTWDKPPIAAKPEMRRESNQFFTDARHETNSQNEGERESVPTGSESRRESTSSISRLKIPSNDTGEKRGSGERRGSEERRGSGEKVGTGERRGSDQFLTRNDSSRSEELTPPLIRRGGNKSRKDSDSSRGRMGSPSGKSHDSSDSDSWGRRQQLISPGHSLTREGRNSTNGGTTYVTTDAVESPGQKRRISGETRLDRLVRKPSGERVLRERISEPRLKPDPRPSTLERNVETRTLSLENRQGAPPLPKPRKITRKPRTGEKKEVNEPLYDQVCAEDEDEEVEDEYDNHLLYQTSKPDMNSSREKPQDKGSVVEIEEEESNYVNIQYFLHQSRAFRQDSRDLDLSEDELQSLKSSKSDSKSSLDGQSVQTGFRTSSEEKTGSGPGSLGPETGQERLKMLTHILTSILDSEAIYLECLSVCLQYMKAMKVTLTTPTPLIPKEDFEIIFYKIPELYEFHHHFHESLKKQIDRWNGVDRIGHHFKMLAQQTRIYAQFISNYPKALDTLHRCSQTYQQFADLTGSIKLRTLKGQQQGQSVSLEDLLHKPVARVQKNCMSLQDLLKHIPSQSSDFTTLTESLQLIQSFLNEYNIEHRGELYPHQERSSRHLVKNSFIVELAEGSRKLRHLFLFNDVLVCAKYKTGNKGEKFTFQLKWYIPLSEALIVEEPSSEPKETKPANIVALKTGAAALRDQIVQVQREDEWRGKGRGGGGRMSTDKHRKQLAELEAQLVLASPHLLFQVSSKSGKTFSFFLSSEFERSQWVETLKTLQSNLPPNTSQAHSLSMVELQTWISSCRKFLKTNMGSFLMRSARDEPLLIGDLHINIKQLSGLTRHADLFVVAEIDSYGHYFRKVKTRTMTGTLEPVWNEEFTVELEGSENLRLLVYQEGGAEGVVLRGRACMELSRNWIKTEYAEQRISIGDVILTCEIKFVGFEETVRRVPQSKPAGLFKTPIHQTTRKEKRAVPFIITSCVREVERRGISEVGIYRVSGSSADMVKLRKAYESNPYEAEQLLKECDIHSVAGICKQYLRDLPECIFSSEVYLKLFQAYSIPDEERRTKAYLQLFSLLPQNPNQACIVFLIEHLVRVSQMEYQNKMSLHNMATVFGPTMLHAGLERDKKGGDLLATSTVDVMAQSGILHFFLTRRARGDPIQINDKSL